MHSLLHSIPFRDFLSREGFSLFIALMIAQLFYHWHSFILEATGFLATWYVLGWVFSLFTKKEVKSRTLN